MQVTSSAQIVVLIAQRIADHQVANFILRGMNNTGRTAKSWQVELESDRGDTATAVITALSHVEFLNRGVAGKDVAYYPGSGKKESKLINGLITYFKSKGLNDKEAKGAAFGTATLALKRGLPKDKKKLGFLELSTAQQKDVDNYASKLSDNLVNVLHDIHGSVKDNRI